MDVITEENHSNELRAKYNGARLTASGFHTHLEELHSSGESLAARLARLETLEEAPESAEKFESMRKLLAEIQLLWERPPAPPGFARFTTAKDLAAITPGMQVTFLGFEKGLAGSEELGRYEQANLVLGESYPVKALFRTQGLLLIEDAEGNGREFHFTSFGRENPDKAAGTSLFGRWKRHLLGQ